MGGGLEKKSLREEDFGRFEWEIELFCSVSIELKVKNRKGEERKRRSWVAKSSSIAIVVVIQTINTPRHGPWGKS